MGIGFNGSSWISVTITQVRWFPSSSLGTDTTKLQLRVIFHDDSIAREMTWTREAGASRLGSQAGAWEPAANKIIQRIDRNDGRTRLSRQSTRSQICLTPIFLTMPVYGQSIHAVVLPPIALLSQRRLSMQLTITLPDVLPNEMVLQFIKRVEEIFTKVW